MSSHKSSSSSPQRRPSGSIRRFIARHGSNLPSSSNAAQTQNEATLVPVRPEALRPYMGATDKSKDRKTEDIYTPSNVASTSRSSHLQQPSSSSAIQFPNTQQQQTNLHQNTQYLAQAANYASLANLVKPPSTEYPTIPQIESKHSNLAHPSIPSKQGTRHRLVRTKSGRKVIQTIRSIAAQTPSNNVEFAHPPSFQEFDQQSWEAAPRLSMSSVESSGGSEVKTPESMNANLSWQYANGEKGTKQSAFVAPELDGSMSVSPRLTPSSPAFVDMSDAFHHAQGLAAVGFSTAEDVVQSSMDPKLIHAARNMDDENDYQMNMTPLSTSPTKQSATIKAKRPDALHKLPGTSFHTDRTVTPTTSEHDSLGQVQTQEEKQTSSLTSGMCKEVKKNECPNEKVKGAEYPRNMTPSSVVGSLSPSIGCAASPDSWRTLLPEHDRFYIPSEALSSRTSSMAGSDILQRNPVHSNNADYDDAGNRRRWSNESNSCGNSHDNSRNPLYDLDGSFGGARAAFAPLKYSYDQSSRSLTSPLMQHDEQESMAGNSEPLRKQVSQSSEKSSMTDLQKRHASFSTFDKGKFGQRSTFQQSPLLPSDFNAYNFKRSTAMTMSSSAASSLASVGAVSPGLISVVTEAQEGTDDSKPHYTVTPFPTMQKHNVIIRHTDAAGSSLAEVMPGEPSSSPQEILVEAFNKSLKEGLCGEDDRITKRIISSTTTTTTTTITVVTDEDDLMVDQYVNRYELQTCLPGFRLEHMVLETKRDHQLKITAQKNEIDRRVDQKFERKIKFGIDADLNGTKAFFDGLTLYISVPRIQSGDSV